MKAYLRSVRIAPKKANLLARMVRGLPVPEAVEELRLTNKKAARILEKMLRSAIANASHNDRQDPQTMIVKSVVVNQGMAYRRGMPKARGQQRPYRKFLSHIELELGFAEEKKTKKESKEPKESKEKKTKAAKASPDSSVSSESSSVKKTSTRSTSVSA